MVTTVHHDLITENPDTFQVRYSRRSFRPHALEPFYPTPLQIFGRKEHKSIDCFHKQHTTTSMTTMMELIDGDIAKNIWGFFLVFDDNDTTASKPVETPSHEPITKSAHNGSGANDLVSNTLDRRIDFRSIRSLRAVNKFFYNAFEEFCGWSRCALAIKREYKNLLRTARLFDNWNFVVRAQALRTANSQATLGSTSSTNPVNSDEIGWTPEQRRQVGRFVSRAMERRKLSNFRRNQLIRMLNCGPFTKDEKLLTNTTFFVVQ